jgi:hypothetical protein
MKASDLTRWGACLLHLRGVCAGLMLAYLLTSMAEPVLLFSATGGLVASGLITPILRALGFRRLAERAGDVGTKPRASDVERALRSSLDDGLSVQEAVRFHHQIRGWDVMDLYPAVAMVAKMPPKEAIRLVMAATTLTGSEERRQAVEPPDRTAISPSHLVGGI